MPSESAAQSLAVALPSSQTRYEVLRLQLYRFWKPNSVFTFFLILRFLYNYVLYDIFLYHCIQNLWFCTTHDWTQLLRIWHFFCLRVDANRNAPAGGEYRHPGASDRSQPAGMTAVSFSVSNHAADFQLLELVALFPFIPRVLG